MNEVKSIIIVVVVVITITITITIQPPWNPINENKMSASVTSPSPSSAVPLTPHNQKGNTKSGPAPDLITALRNDNRDQLLSLMALDPHSNDVTISPSAVAPSSRNENSSNINISHRQRLIFATDSLRTLLLYHTLLHPDRLNNTNNKKKKKSNAGTSKNPNFYTSILSHDDQEMGLSPQNPYGIVNTKIIFPNNHTCTPLFGHDDGIGGSNVAADGSFSSETASASSPSTSTTTGLHGGIETIYNPHPQPVASTANISSLFNIHHDVMMDQGTGSGTGNLPPNIIIYFVLPIPDHVRAVCKIINAFLKSQNMNSSSIHKTGMMPMRSNNPFDTQDGASGASKSTGAPISTKLKHRIVFLQRCTKLCSQILYNEHILPPPEATADNTTTSNNHSSNNNNSSSTNSRNSSSSVLLVNNLKNIVVHTLDINIVPVEDDILTLLETSSTMADVCPIRGIPSLQVNCIADSIMKIQTLSCGGGFGTGNANGENGDGDVCDDGGDIAGGYIPRIQSFGKISESVLKRCYELRREDYYDSCIMSNSDVTVAHDHDDHRTNNKNGSITPKGDIQAMMLLDRRIDLVTPMITPLTYEGLLDDVLSIQSGILHVKTDIIDPPEEEDEGGDNHDDNNSSKSQSSRKKKQLDKKKKKKDRPLYTLLPLNDQDTLYVEVRDQHVEKFGSFLQEQAKALKESHANFSNKDKDLTEIHMFVKQIPIFTQNLKSLTHHIHLAELIKHTTMQSEFRQRWQIERSIVESESCFDVIEDLIASQYNVWRVLRLLCLHSLTNGGIKTNKLDALKREVVQTYGYEFVFLLQNLESIGLLRKKDTLWDTASSSSFVTMRKHLQLIQADVDPLDPDDVSYVSSGFAPISARIIQTAMKGWNGKEDALKEIPGRGIDVVQKYPPEEYNTALKRNIGAPLGVWAKQFKMNEDECTDKDANSNKKKKPVLLVYFVGGITYAEIAALRFMSKRSSFPFSIICCTTKIINGTSFLQSLA